MKHSLQDQVFFAGAILLAATPNYWAARPLAISARAVRALMWVMQFLWLGRSVCTLFCPRPAFPITKSCLYRCMLANPIRWARFGLFHTMRQFISTAATRGYMTELAAFAGLALKMIQDASVLRASEERLNLALHQQEMLTREMSHRVKNLFAIAIGMVSISAKSAATPQDMAKTLLGRLNALARAHDLVLRGLQGNGRIIRRATLTRLLEAIFQPYVDIAPTGDLKPTVISGPDLMIGERALTSLALVLHELATNAAKYGALSISEGLVHVTWQIAGDNLLLRWEEHKGPTIEKTPISEGFGSILVRRSIVGQLGGELDYIWKPEGFSALISIPTERLSS